MIEDVAPVAQGLIIKSLIWRDRIRAKIDAFLIIPNPTLFGGGVALRLESSIANR